MLHVLKGNMALGVVHLSTSAGRRGALVVHEWLRRRGLANRQLVGRPRRRLAGFAAAGIRGPVDHSAVPAWPHVERRADNSTTQGVPALAPPMGPLRTMTPLRTPGTLSSPSYNPLKTLLGPPIFGLRDLWLSESYHPGARLGGERLIRGEFRWTPWTPVCFVWRIPSESPMKYTGGCDRMKRLCRPRLFRPASTAAQIWT